jgi:hypothetical protein
MSHTQDYLNELKKGCGHDLYKFVPYSCGYKENTICSDCKACIEACEKLIEAIEKDINKMSFLDFQKKQIKEILRGGA